MKFRQAEVTQALVTVTTATTLAAAEQASSFAGTTFQNAEPGSSKLGVMFAGIALLASSAALYAYAVISARQTPKAQPS